MQQAEPQGLAEAPESRKTGLPEGRMAWAALVGAVLAAHGLMLTRALVWDDTAIVGQIDLAGRWRLFAPDPFGFVRPGKTLLFSLMQGLFGSHALGYQAAGLVALLGAVLLVRRFAREFLSPAGALAAALVYAVHPLHVEGAGWAAAGNGTWMTILALGYYLAVLGEARSPRRLGPAAATALFLGALLLKEDAIVLPLAAWLWVWAAGLRVTRRLAAMAAVQLALAGAIVLVTRALSESAGQTMFKPPYPGWVIALSSPRNVLAHLLYFALPFRWMYYRDVNFAPANFFAMLAAGWVFTWVAACWFWSRRKQLGLPAACVAFAMLALLPTANLLPLGNDLFGVRYLTHAGLGLALLAGFWIDKALCRGGGARTAALAALGVWLAACGVFSNFYHTQWRSEEVLFTRLAAINHRAKYHQALSMIQYARKDFRGAEERMRRGLAIEPDNVDGRVMLGMTLARQGRTAEALAEWRTAERLNPGHADAAMNLADYFDTRYATGKAKDDLKEADRYYRIAAGTWRVNSENAFVNWGLLWATHGEVAAAVRIWEEGLGRFPNSSALKHNLAIARKQGK